MSKIMKHKENIYNFITTKSCFNNLVNKDLVKDFLESEFCLFPIALLSVFGAQVKKNKIKSYHTLHIASAIILMLLTVAINENKKMYEEKYGKNNIRKLLTQSTIFIFESITQNMVTLENSLGTENSSKIHKKISSILHEKLLLLAETNIKENNLKIKRTDIIKFKFNNKNIIETNYKKIKRINKDELVNYLNDKYGSIGQCVFLFGWLLGMGTDSIKTIESITKTGNSFGLLVKLTCDFCNLENNINDADENSYNFLVNYGIHECFKLYDKNKVNFLEGCMLNEIYNSSIKELIEKIDKSYEKCLKNTDLELCSQYSSFVSEK